jgi:hypothetical protein
MSIEARCLLLVALLSAMTLGCARHDPEAGQSPDEAQDTPANTTPRADGWIGRWTGVEGTYLEVAGGNGEYEITIKDLDVARTFKGSAVGDHIEFQRDGGQESLRATNGDETGMKWLVGKTNCLTIKPGEGYCRD